jgi:hypothetical protein
MSDQKGVKCSQKKTKKYCRVMPYTGDRGRIRQRRLRKLLYLHWMRNSTKLHIICFPWPLVLLFSYLCKGERRDSKKKKLAESLTMEKMRQELLRWPATISIYETVPEDEGVPSGRVDATSPDGDLHECELTDSFSRGDPTRRAGPRRRLTRARTPGGGGDHDNEAHR